MGILDFETVFDELDSSRKGYVTIDQVKYFLESIFEDIADDKHVYLSVEKICGPGSETIPKERFYLVLEEIERRKTLDSEAYWDFQALDYSGSGLIALKDALLLFQEYHADQFSLDTWHEFLCSRDSPDADVYFNEIRDWLCDIPRSSYPSTKSEVRKERASLEHRRTDAAYQDLEDMKVLLQDEDLDRQERGERTEDILHHSKRKLNKWNQHGLDSLLHDDGLGQTEGDEQMSKLSDTVTTSNVMEALNLKYSLLQDKVIVEMASFAANMDSEKSETFQQIKRLVTASIKSKSLAENVDDLPGAKVELSMSLLGLIGDLHSAEANRKEKFKSLASELQTEERTDEQVDAELAERYKRDVAGPRSCGAILTQLDMRHKAERDAVLHSLHQSSSSLPPSAVLALAYWHLLRQLRLLQLEPFVTSAAISVGLAERKQEYKPKRYDWDRQRSEILANLRLESRRGHRPIKRSTAAPDLDSLQNLALAGIKQRLVEEMEQRYFLEREAMVFLLQGPDSKSSFEAAAKMSLDERKLRIRTLRNQREEWKMMNNSDSSVNHKLLQEATGLYFEQSRADVESKDHNATDSTVMSFVLADLQQRQEVEFEKTVSEIHKKNAQEVTRLVLSEIEATKEEHFNSIAYVILGCVDLSAEDTAFLKVLDGKYKALRDQVFVFGLVDKMGSEWKGLSKENKQREILRQRKEEKRLRGEGLLEQMSALIGPRSQALALLPTLVGEDKVFPNSSPPQTSESRSINLLADLVPRFDQEQDSLVSWLRSEEVKGSTLRSKHGQLTRIAMEKFAASAERDHETALLFVGLLERIGMALSGRSKSDREKQILLAQKRATLRKKCVNQGEKQKPPPEEKDKSNENDERTMQAIYMRAVLRRHYKEREVMLNLLQDEGMEELLEAAAVMSVDQGRKRMQELQDKRENMDLDDKANQEEHTSILEEAGAIRCASKKFAMVMDGGRAVLMDEVVVQLLAELQDLQDRDLATILNQLGTLNGHEMQEKAWAEEKAKKNSHSHLVMKVFMKFDGGSSDIDFDQLLDAKYRKLRDHLIDECLSQRQGKLKWAKMGQKQKNKLISTFQAKESALWNEGDSGSLSACLTPAFTLKPTLPYLSGMSRQQYSSAVWAGSEDPIQENEGLNPDDQGNGETISFLHRRYMAEVDFVKNYIAGCLEKVPEESDKKLLENKLKWECQLVSSVRDFVTASLVCGLAERQNTDRVFRLKLDHDRYGLLAQQLLACKREQIKKSADVVKGDDASKLQEAVMTLLHKKHQDEWNILCQMMASDRFKEVRELVATETQQQKSDRLMVLHGIREKFDLAASSEHQTILEEAVTVKREMRRCHLSGQSSSGEVGDSEVNVSLMADLLKTQLVEAEIYLGAFSSESNEDLIENQQAIAAELTQSHAINIADVVFTAEGHDSADSQNQDGLLEEAVDGKYDALRDQLLIQALINEMGEAEWNRLSEKERQRRLMELKLKERQLRREGRYDEAAALLGSLLNDEEKLRQLLGDSKAEQERKLRERLERRKKRLAEGMTEEECDELEAEEIAREEEEEREKRKNILLYLEHCHDEEKAALLRRLAEMKDESERQRQKQLEMLRLRREQRRLREEDKFDSAAMVLGLSEENDKRHKMSKDEERQRQQDLARQRLEAARQRKLQGENMVRGETIVLPEGEMEDESKVGETALRMLDRRHQLERDLLIKLLDEGSESEQRDEVRVLTDDELKMKLLAAQELYELWRNSDSGEKEDGEKILAEVAVLSLEVKKRDMQADGELASDEDVKVALLAELQMKQDGEAAQMMETLTTVDNEHKKQILNSQRKQLEDKRYDNVAGILFTFANEEDIFGEGKGEDEEEKTEEEKEDDKVVKALEKKYDAMRDKLLIEALMKEMGEGDWNRLSELERQKKLLELKMKEKRLRREGKMDEVAALLGQFLDDNEEMRRMLGETEEDQKRRMQEKLALRRKLKEEREAQGLAVDDETLDDLVEEEDKKIRRRNVLENLDHQFEAEKAALLAAFKKQNDQLEREKERQLAVAKLKREERRIKQEEKFESAANLMALWKETDKTVEQNLLSERDRQRQIARDRIEALKKQRADKNKGKTPATDDEPGVSSDITNETVFLQDSILAGMEKHQGDERDMLMTLVSKYEHNKDKGKQFAKMSDEDVKLQLLKLEQNYAEWEKKVSKSIADVNLSNLPPKKKLKIQMESQKRQKEQAAILEQALSHKFELELRQLKVQHPDISQSEAHNELSICALADLQEKQMRQVESTQDSIKNQAEDQLKEMRKMQRAVNSEGWYKTLASTLFSVSLMMGELHTEEDMEKKLMEEFEQQKKELLERGGFTRKAGQREAIDVDAMLKELEDQYNSRKQALSSDLQRQREMFKQRLALKKQSNEDKEWNAAAMVGQIVAATQANDSAAKLAREGQRGKQDNLLQQKLQARREARRQAAEEAADTLDSPMSRESSLMGQASDRSRSPRQTPTFSLTREKTVVDVRVSDEQKQEMYDQVVQQGLKRQQQIFAEQSRQEELLKRKLELRSSKRENEAAALYSLGERQKTVLQQSQRDERERQLAQMKERVSKMRESRSKSPRGGSMKHM